MLYKIKRKARNFTNQSNIFKKIYLTLNAVKTSSLSILSDEAYSKFQYYQNTGKRLDLDNPRTFNEKLWWLKINYRNPLMTQCSDKIKVRDYLKDIGLAHILTDIQGVYSKAEDIPFNDLQGKFFIKCNHVSGINAIYDSKHPEHFDFTAFKKEFNNALSMNYYYQSREWNYKNIKPRIIIEKFIETESELLDYRFFCFHGEAKLIFVDIDTASEDGKHNPDARRNIYDRNFKLQDFTVGRKNFNPDLAKAPDNLNQMLTIAETIAEPFPFCRVDLYNINGEIKFGEITFYPGGGTQEFSSDTIDSMVASWIKLQ